jgi:sugar phosphate isomerase/epimerase
MRLGIAPLSVNFIVDRVIREKGVEGLLSFSFPNVIERVAKAGYNHCEITMDAFQIFPIQITKENIDELKQIKKDYGITYSVHMPLLSIEMAGPNKFIREGSVNALVDAYNSLKNLENDIEMFIIHSSGDTVTDILKFIQDPEIKHVATDLFVSFAVQSLSKFIEETGIDRRKIGIENIEFPLEGTIKIIQELNTKLCLDTAHLLGRFSGDYDLIEITKKYFDLIGEIHLQDYIDNPLADHGVLGTGKHFPPDFMNFIQDLNYQGPCVFELNEKEAFESVRYIKNLPSKIEIPDIKNQPFF